MTATHATGCQDQSLEWTVDGERLHTIRRAGRVELTPRPEKRRENQLVQAHDRHQHQGEGHSEKPKNPAQTPSVAAPPIDTPSGQGRPLAPVAEALLINALASSPSNSLPRSAVVQPTTVGRARTTSVLPAGRSDRRSRIQLLNCLVIRCLTTDPPTPRPTANATRGPVGALREPTSVTSAKKCTTRFRPRQLTPRRTVVLISTRPRRRAAAGIKTGPAIKPSAQHVPCSGGPR